MNSLVFKVPWRWNIILDFKNDAWTFLESLNRSEHNFSIKASLLGS